MSSARPLAAEANAIGPLDAVRFVRAAGGGLAVQALLHAQLVQVEWQQDKERLLKMLGAGLVGFACLVCALLCAAALVLAAAWDTPYRIPVAAALVACFALATVAAWQRFQAWSALGSQSFAASREELAADVALLKSRA